jgi:hypothetical protein
LVILGVLCGCRTFSEGAGEVVKAVNPSNIAAEAVGQKVVETGEILHKNKTDLDKVMDDIYPDPKAKTKAKPRPKVNTGRRTLHRPPSPTPPQRVTNSCRHHY